jgi:hypothetical protein
VVAFARDVPVPGLKADVRAGGAVELHAAQLACVVEADRSRGHPIMRVGRFASADP